MGLLIPAPRAYSQEFNYSGRPAVTWGTTLTGSATPHALPASPTQVTASTAYDADWVKITIHATAVAATVTDSLINIYLGGAGAEVLFIPNLVAGWGADLGTDVPHVYQFPVRITRGVRISADLRNLIPSDTAQLMIDLYQTNGALWSGAGVDQVGAVTASSRGTTVTPGAASEGTFTTLGTTNRLWRYVLPVIMSNSDTTQVTDSGDMDIGTAGALIHGLEHFQTAYSSSERDMSYDGMGRWVEIASGTSLDARIQDLGADIEAKSVICYGVY